MAWKQLMETAAGPTRTRPNAWGREITEALGPITEPELRRSFAGLGLDESRAAAGARGVMAGKYLSFEDAVGDLRTARDADVTPTKIVEAAKRLEGRRLLTGDGL